MLSFIRDVQAQKAQKTRQITLETAFARTPALPEPQDASTTPSLTTGASLTDYSSEANDDSLGAQDSTGNSKRSRSNVGNYKESGLAAKSVSPLKKPTATEGRAISGTTTLVESRHGSTEQLLENLERNLQAFDDMARASYSNDTPEPPEAKTVSPLRKSQINRNRATPSANTIVESGDADGDQLLKNFFGEDWDVGLPTAPLKTSPKRKTPLPKSPNVRTRIINRASQTLGTTRSSLGKRTRDAAEHGKEKAAALYGMTSSRLRSREDKSQTKSSQQPAQKRVRLSKDESPAETAVANTAKKPAKKPTKFWLSQGLYVGQERSFDARLTESANKTTKPSTGPTSQRKTLMPLPMFAGQRLLEQGRNFRLPFDVFSPLPPGQPKPDEWKKTRKNVFVGDAANVWKKAKPLEDSTCVCSAETGCDENCFNQFMLYECDDNNCKLGAELCSNRPFAGLKERQKAGGKYNVGVEVLKTADRGYGIRANRTFAPNQIIVEYTGEIITQDECEARMRGRYKDAECYYLMDFDQAMILDATRGSIARFVNHSCSPNCRMIKWTVQGKPRMALFAGDKGIMTAEELTYDYNFNPYSVKNVQQCRCGSDNCRGVLGPRPKEIKEALNPIVGAGKRKIQQVVEDAVEGVKQAAKRRKINVPVPSSVRNLVSKAKEQVSGAKNKKESANKKKALPLGWVYVADMEEPPPPAIRNIFETDPETLLRSTKRRLKTEEIEGGGTPIKKQKMATSSAVEIPPRTSSKNMGKSSNVRGRFSEDFQEENANISKRRNSFKSMSQNARKNVVRTIKGRTGGSRTPGKSIRVIGAV